MKKMQNTKEEEFKIIFKSARIGLAILDLQTNFLEFNDFYLSLTGYTREELLKKSCIDISVPEYIERSKAMLQRVLKEGYVDSYQKGCITKNGTIVYVDMTITLLSDKERIFITVKDITEERKQKALTHQLAYYDSLTKLPNRVLLSENFKKAKAHCNRTNSLLAVCFIDLDNFKHINDKFGHNEGDKLLIEFSKRLKDSLRGYDTVSRIGGDEFVFLLSNINSKKECESLLNRILNKLAQPYICDKNRHVVTVSCGVAFYSEDATEEDQLIRCADHAMYQAKILGKNRYSFFNYKEKTTLEQQNSLLSQISQAIINNEMVLYYQPKVNMITGHMYGAEALIRWSHPTRGLLSPFEFLPYIQKTDVMIQLGKWVLEDALKQMDIWLSQGKEWHISINIDAYHLMSDSFFTTLTNALEKYDNRLNSFLEIELLETEEFNDLPIVAERILKCKSLGIKFSLDDFGTGYSSLYYLKKLPIDSLKIDRSFVRDILTDTKDKALISGIIALSKSFGLGLIAEGVETIEQGLALLQLGCIYTQGYKVAKPMPADNIIPWNKNYTQVDEWYEFGSAFKKINSNKIKELKKHIDLIDNNRDDIVSLWVSDKDVIDILNKHDIATEFFANNYAHNVLKYFIDVINGSQTIGSCPAIAQFIKYLENNHITVSELFTICINFREAMMTYILKQDKMSKELYDSVSYVFDENFRGVLQFFDVNLFLSSKSGIV